MKTEHMHLTQMFNLCSKL